MLELQMALTYLRAHHLRLSSRLREDRDRGSIVQEAVWIALIVAVTIAVVAILKGKALSTADNVKTQ